MTKLYTTTFLAILLASTTAGAASISNINKPTNKAPAAIETAAGDEVDNDPIEPVNRAIFKFNTAVDDVVLKPTSKAYRTVVPAWGRQRVSNAVYNISEPVTIVNSALQGDGENAFTSFWRFVFNSTFGLLGTFDVASELGLKARSEDFGQTLHTWGWENSSYVVLPILGPSTVRDTVGLGVDYGTNPFNYNAVVSKNTRIAIAVATALDTRTRLLDTTDEIDRTSLDRYSSYKSAYIQNRDSAANNGKSTPAY
jgi:phospholipid-binding lipoprotein MlaA